MTQPDLFTSHPVVRSSPTLSAPERKRCETQNDRILARLRRGPVTNRELSEISLKYTGRLSELRKAGYAVRVVSRDRVTGLTVYAIA